MNAYLTPDTHSHSHILDPHTHMPINDHRINSYPRFILSSTPNLAPLPLSAPPLPVTTGPPTSDINTTVTPVLYQPNYAFPPTPSSTTCSSASTPRSATLPPTFSLYLPPIPPPTTAPTPTLISRVSTPSSSSPNPASPPTYVAPPTPLTADSTQQTSHSHQLSSPVPAPRPFPSESTSSSSASIIAPASTPAPAADPAAAATCAAFVSKLYYIVSRPEYSHYVRFTRSGTSIVIFSDGNFAWDICHRFFKHTNVSSFVRQLNLYGFTRQSMLQLLEDLALDETDNQTDSSCAGFSHPHFRRGHPEELHLVKPKTVRIRNTSASSKKKRAREQSADDNSTNENTSSAPEDAPKPRKVSRKLA